MSYIKNRKFLKIAILTTLIVIVLLISCLNLFIKKQNNNPLKLNNGNVATITTPKSKNPKDENKEESLIHIESIILKQLNNNSWDRIKANFSAEYRKDNQGTYFYDKYTLYCNITYVNNIVFNSNYKDSIIGGIKVGTPIKDIQKILGEPTFESKELEMIGYRTPEIYAFFYKDEISIYPNKNINNKDFERLLFLYANKQYPGNRTNFIVEINKNYPDFISKIEENYIKLYSLNRQIEIKLYEDKDIEIIVYDGYKFGPYMQDYLNIVKVEETNLIENKEVERKET